jgi:4-methyl-5(b-hydroxyethyl)-thiazole monophosphate biosynthesis
MTASVLIPVADGSEDIESVTLIDVLRRAEADVTVAAIGDSTTITAARQTRITADAQLADVLDRNFDLIVLPGGRGGAEAMRDCAPLIERLRRQKDAGKLYGAICASPGVALAPHGLLDDVAATGHPGFQDPLPNQQRVQERVVRDGNCLTSQGPGTALEYALALVEALFGAEKREQVSAPMVL